MIGRWFICSSVISAATLVMTGIHQRMETESRNNCMTSVVLAAMMRFCGCLRIVVILL
jgi:hypothetical protein